VRPGRGQAWQRAMVSITQTHKHTHTHTHTQGANLTEGNGNGAEVWRQEGVMEEQGQVGADAAAAGGAGGAGVGDADVHLLPGEFMEKKIYGEHIL
jgi:hypothetical protein